MKCLTFSPTTLYRYLRSCLIITTVILSIDFFFFSFPFYRATLRFLRNYSSVINSAYVYACVSTNIWTVATRPKHTYTSRLLLLFTCTLEVGVVLILHYGNLFRSAWTIFYSSSMLKYVPDSLETILLSTNVFHTNHTTYTHTKSSVVAKGSFVSLIPWFPRHNSEFFFFFFLFFFAFL